MGRAAEPTDVFWENMSVTFFARLKYRIIAMLITTAVLGIAFGVNYGLTSFSKYLDKQAKDSDDDFINNINRIIALIRSIVVAVMNFILKKIMLKLTLMEKDNTFTKYNLSVTIKYFVATAINTVLIPLVTNLDKSTWFTSGGLVVEVFFNLVILCFITPWIYVLSFPIIMKKVLIWKHKKNKEKCKLTQRELNTLYEGPNLEIAKWYSEILLILALAIFYTPLFPMMPLIGLLGILTHYWI